MTKHEPCLAMRAYIFEVTNSELELTRRHSRVEGMWDLKYNQMSCVDSIWLVGPRSESLCTTLSLLN